MRRLIGSVMLVAGTAGLAYWASADHAVRMERQITADAQIVAQAMTLQSAQPVSVFVSGRDVRVPGTAPSLQGLEVLQRSFGAIDGVRLVDVSGVDVVPVADPFAISITKDGATLRAQGVLPSPSVRADLGGVNGPFADLAIAAGVPDDQWGNALAVGLEALAALPSGNLTVVDRQVTLTGDVSTPTDQGEIATLMQNLPQGYRYNDALDILDDGTPLRLDVRQTAGITRATGKLPSDLALSAVTNRFANAITDIVVSRMPAERPDWPTAAEGALDALAALSGGRLQMEGLEITLEGSGTPDGVAQANAALDDVPNGYAVSHNVSVEDDGAPLSVLIDFDGAAMTASGKYPAQFSPRIAGVTTVLDTGVPSFLTSETFLANANAGMAALGQLQSGTLFVTDTTLTLTGTATSPQIGAAIDGVLADIPALVTRDIKFLDDGSPSAWTMTYTAATGAVVEGRLPTTLAKSDLSEALGLAIAGMPGTAAEDNRASSAPDVLVLVAGILPELEQMTLTASEGGSALDLVTKPAVDIDLVATDLAQRLPADVAFSIQPLNRLPATGTARTNAATGLREVFIDGFWIPDLNFTTTRNGCTEQSRALLAGGQISFLSGSARLNATSIRTINGLAAVAVPCVEADLNLEVSGHTDPSGDADQNQLLSQDRADAVRAALIDRGVPARAITSIGFGASQPIAPNDTPEGRTQNRRTEIDWFEKDAVRDP